MASKPREEVLSGVVISETTVFTLYELSCACTVHVERIRALVDEGILEPQGRSPQDWRFPGASVARARTALRLEDELEINAAGVALALELLDELRDLRQRLGRHERNA
ncbi:MAG: chaperone modulator CbpM [Gammaproteobacteria bacterium]|nr:chaperone modulator CbpM [Gammaproteobacteria bacterium]